MSEKRVIEGTIGGSVPNASLILRFLDGVVALLKDHPEGRVRVTIERLEDE